MDKVLSPLVALLERFVFPVVMVLGVLVFLKFRAFFFGDEKEKQETEQNQKEHNDALIAGYEVPAQASSESEKKRIILRNGEKAKLFKQALYAERIKSQTAFGLSLVRESKLMELATQMKQHKVSISGVHAQYMKLTGDDMYKDVRTIMGNEYAVWVSLAGSVK